MGHGEPPESGSSSDDPTFEFVSTEEDDAVKSSKPAKVGAYDCFGEGLDWVEYENVLCRGEKWLLDVVDFCVKRLCPCCWSRVQDRGWEYRWWEGIRKDVPERYQRWEGIRERNAVL